MPQIKPKYAILVTGAAGGLGSAIVHRCLSLPSVDLVVATDILPNEPEPFSQNEQIAYYQMDVTSEESIRELHSILNKENILVKYLVNNAGVNQFYAISESNTQMLDDILKVNLYGHVLMVSGFLDHLAETRGRVIQISSDSIRLPIPFHPYPASKIALEAFSRSMRPELKLLGIDLVMIRPGAIQTNFVEDMKSISNPVKNSRYTVWFNNFAKLANQNIGKRSKPLEVADLVARILQKKNPKQYYTINKNAKISFLRLFPERLQDTLIRRSLKN